MPKVRAADHPDPLASLAEHNERDSPGIVVTTEVGPVTWNGMCIPQAVKDGLTQLRISGERRLPGAPVCRSFEIGSTLSL
jgi:hypothetical protein